MALKGTLKWTYHTRKDNRIPHGEGYSITLVGADVYVFGGTCGNSRRQGYVYSIQRRTWRHFEGVEYRYQHSTVLVDDKLYILGGARRGVRIYSVATFDLINHNTQEILKRLPMHRMTATFLEKWRDIVIIFPFTSQEVYVLNVDNATLRKYRKINGTPPRASGLKILECNRQIFAVSTRKPRSKISILTLNRDMTGAWEDVKIPGWNFVARSDMIMHDMNGYLVILGGNYFNLNRDHADEIIILDTASQKLVEVGPQSLGRFVQSGIWPQDQEIKGSVVVNGRLLYLTCGDYYDVVELEFC